jgi:hypothetical protein
MGSLLSISLSQKLLVCYEPQAKEEWKAISSCYNYYSMDIAVIYSKNLGSFIRLQESKREA